MKRQLGLLNYAGNRNFMPSKFQRMWKEAERKIRIYERVHDRAADVTIMKAALTVINRHDLAREFVDELTKPEQKPD